LHLLERKRCEPGVWTVARLAALTNPRERVHPRRW